MSTSSSSSPHDRSHSKRRRIEANENGPRHGYVSPLAHQEEQGASHQEYEQNTIRDQARAHFGNQYKGPVTQNFYGQHTQPATENERLPLLAALRFDQMDERHASISKAHTKTCRWLLARQEYQDWRDIDQLDRHHGFLWIKGKPGAGKSTMMKYLLDHDKRNRKEEAQISFFFNARGHPLERSVEGMYRSLTLQMLEALPRLQSVLTDRQRKICEGSNLSVGLLKELFSHLVLDLGRDRLSCYIDALDECDVNQIRDDVVYFFRDLAEETVPLHAQFFVCFSSRHYPQVSLKMCKEIILEEQDEHEQDIANYIKHVLDIGKSKISQEIMTEVQNKADGVFLWVVLVIPILNEEYDRGRIHALKRRLPKIPTRLSELFQEILTRGSACKDEVLLSLDWIAFAQRPLRSEELYYGIMSGIEPKAEAILSPSELSRDDMNRYIVDCTKGLAKATKGKEPVIQFIHETVKEYLVQGNGLAQLDSANINNPQGHGHNRLKECCMNYTVSMATAYNALKCTLLNPLPKANSDEAKRLRWIICSEHPFLEYAVANVLYHADEAQARGITQESFVHHFPCLEPLPDGSNLTNDWRKFNDLLEKYEIRRYNGCPKQYIFADKSLDSLLPLAFADEWTPTPQFGRHITPLRAAVANNSRSTTKLLLSLPEYKSIPRDVFQVAVSESSTDVLAMLIDHNRSALTNTEFAISLAHRVLSRGNAAILAVLLDKGVVDVDCGNAANGGGETLLYRALTPWRSDEMILLLMERGAHIALTWIYITHAGIRGLYNPVQTFCDSQRIPVPKALLNDLLCAASHSGDINAVSTLLSRGADVDPAPRADFMTALGAASCRGHLDIVRLLLNCGADVNAKQYERKPLVEAAYNSQLEAVQVLLEAKADINAFSKMHDYCLHGNAFYMACRWGHADIVLLLLDSGLDVNAVCDSEASSPLLVASKFPRPNIVKALLERGAEIDLDTCKWIEDNSTSESELVRTIVELLRNAQISRSSARASIPSTPKDSKDRLSTQEQQSAVESTSNQDRPREMSVAWLIS